MAKNWLYDRFNTFLERRMPEGLFPRALTNTYLGSWVAVWLVVPVLIVKTLIGFNFSGLNPLVSVAGILESVDGVPLSSFSANNSDIRCSISSIISLPSSPVNWRFSDFM